MSTSHWTSNYWFLLHILSYTYNEKKAHKYIQLIKLSKKILPCPKCRDHFITYFADNKLSQKDINRDTLIKWVIDYHNAVNVMNNSPTYSIEAVNKFYYDGDKLIHNDDKICELLMQLDKNIREKGGDYFAFVKFLHLLRKIYPYDDTKKKLKKIKKNKINAKNFCRFIKA